jgi:hypothetical protein
MAFANKDQALSKERKNGVEHVPSESTEQMMFFTWVRAALPKLIAFHVPNGGKRSLRTAVRLKKEGVTSGIPDIIIAKPAGIYCGMYIELKRQKGGALSEAQKDMVRELKAAGYYVAICRGFEEAREETIAYLSLGEHRVYG